MTTLLASTQERIKKFFKDLVQESARYNMYINAQKSKIIMVVSRQDNISVQVDHEGEFLEQVHDFMGGGKPWRCVSLGSRHQLGEKPYFRFSHPAGIAYNHGSPDQLPPRGPPRATTERYSLCRMLVRAGRAPMNLQTVYTDCR